MDEAFEQSLDNGKNEEVGEEDQEDEFEGKTRRLRMRSKRTRRMGRWRTRIRRHMNLTGWLAGLPGWLAAWPGCPAAWLPG